MHPTAVADLPVNFVNKINRRLAIVIKNIYNGTSGKVDQELFASIGSLLESQVINGYGKNFSQVDFSTPDAGMLTRLTRDVWQFSAAKNYQQLRDMTLALKDEAGKLRSFEQFTEACTQIGDQFNKNWLKTEYNFAVGSSTMAARWSDYLKNADIMPFLKYVTVGDTQVREDHARLDGIIRKITDFFWSIHYPPNGWGCRCDAEQLASSSAKETDKIPDITIPPMFRTNLGQQGLIFPKGHAYYEGVPADEIRKAIHYLPTDAVYKEIYRSEDTFAKVNMHLLHGIDEMGQNVETAKLLADAGYNVKLLPVLGKNDNKIRELVYGTKDFKPGKNPDAIVNKSIADLKRPKAVTKAAIHNAIERGQKQAGLVIIHLPEAANKKLLDRHVLGKMKQAKDIKDVWVFNGSDGLVKYSKP